MSADLATVLAVVAVPFIAAAVTPLVVRWVGEAAAYFAAVVALSCFLLVTMLATATAGHPSTVSLQWIPAYDVAMTFYVDGLAVLVAGLASGVGVLVFVYSRGYMQGEPGQAKYYATMLAFMGSMLGVALAGDLIVLFVFWEFTSVASFILIGFYTGDRSSRRAARKALLITVGGGLFMLVGFLLVASATGTFSLASLVQNPAETQATLRDAGVYLPVLGFLVVGAAAKSAQVPLHVWLPDAMAAPTPVSAFLHAATMVKAGVYLVGRFRPVLVGPDAWTMVVASLGLVTMLVTAVLAVAATDTKELLAYSTASHLGLIVAGFGFADVVGAETGAFHILNHAAFKAALFLVAGILAHEVGTRRIADIGGVARDLPVTAAVTVIAGLSMAGVPPFAGFYSKELLFETAYATATAAGGFAWAFPVIAVLGSVFTFLYSIRFVMLFFGDRPAEVGSVHRPPWTMLAPPVILAGVVAIVSITPQSAIDVIVGVVAESAGGHAAFHVGLPTTVTPPVAMSGLALGGGLVLVPWLDRVRSAIEAVLGVRFVCADYWYRTIVDGFTRAGATATPWIQRGSLRTYAIWTIATTMGLVLTAYLVAGAIPTGVQGLDLATPIILVLLVALVAVTAITVAPSHVAGVLTLSILGFMVAIFYILASAPDLALTQLVVETLVLVIFLLVLDRLPAFYGSIPTARALRDAALSIVVGATVTITVLVTTAATPAAPIDTYFIERAPVPPTHDALLLDYGGGGNVVNVILVDFRAFDTLGEISVIALAGLSVLTLIGLRTQGEPQ
ncbi:MAG: hydrogen gas-evolving membrane-bound hydrogenase subunit E [Halobacteriaceae archaeon]